MHCGRLAKESGQEREETAQRQAWQKKVRVKIDVIGESVGKEKLVREGLC